MGAYRIGTPVPEFTGEVGGLAFAKGVYEGEVPDGPLMYFRAQGYSVEELGASEPVPGEDVPTDPDEMTVKQLKAYAASNGIDLGAATKRDDILAAITAAPPASSDTSNGGDPQ